LIIAATVVSIVMYPRIPETMPTHWSASGEVNGWSSRLFGAWLMPLMMAVVWIVMRMLPHIDPRRANYEKFSGMYEALIDLTLVFMLGLHVLVLTAATGAEVDMARIIPISVGVFFVLMGVMLPRAHPNWFVGIRTPWTLSSDQSWERTHKLGGLLFIITGVLAIAAALVIPTKAVWVMLTAGIGMTVFLFAYSYMVWKGDENRRSAI
jgi:uncharacterized membrane protein